MNMGLEQTGSQEPRNRVDEEVDRLVSNASEQLSPFHKEVMDSVVEEIRRCAKPLRR